jgi:HSP20 family protein
MSQLIPWRRTGDFFPKVFRDRFFRECDDLMGRFHGEEPFLTGWTPTFSPAIDISETDDVFLVKGEIPGIDPKDLHISLAGEVLTITGEKKEEENEEGNGVTHRRERRFGSFSRKFTLPCEVDKDAIEATFENGVLSLSLPKTETAKEKAIRIEVKN